MELVLFFVVVFGCLALIPSSIASRKGHSAILWWVYGFCFWIIALIHSLMLKPTNDVLFDRQIVAGNHKCPSCAEWIKREAKVCRHCGRDVAA